MMYMLICRELLGMQFFSKPKTGQWGLACEQEAPIKGGGKGGGRGEGGGGGGDVSLGGGWGGGGGAKKKHKPQVCRVV